DDEMFFGLLCTRFRCGRTLVAHIHHALFYFGIPGCKCVKGRSLGGLTGFQIKARVMPRAAYGFLGHDPLSERGAVVGAGGADCEEFTATSNEENRHSIGVSKDTITILDRLQRQTFLEIRSCEFLWCAPHLIPQFSFY